MEGSLLSLGKAFKLHEDGFTCLSCLPGMLFSLFCVSWKLDYRKSSHSPAQFLSQLFNSNKPNSLHCPLKHVCILNCIEQVHLT